MIYHYKTIIQNLNVTVSINDKVTGEDEVSLTPANYRDIKNKTAPGQTDYLVFYEADRSPG